MIGIVSKWICRAALVALPLAGFSQRNQAEAIAQVMSNTYNFYGDRLTGTAFMLVRGGQQYFVTAAHLFEPSDKSGQQVNVQIVIQNQLQQYAARVYFHPNRKVDAAVVVFPEQIRQSLVVSQDVEQYREEFSRFFAFKGISTDSMFAFAGMETYFFGFPLGNLGTEFLGVKFPMVKKAIVSGWVNNNGVDLMLLDGHNNLGFSGGPITTYDSATKKMNLLGIVSGYLPEPVNGVHKNGVLSISENSGIIICVDSRYIDEILDRNRKFIQ